MHKSDGGGQGFTLVKIDRMLTGIKEVGCLRGNIYFKPVPRCKVDIFASVEHTTV